MQVKKVHIIKKIKKKLQFYYISGVVLKVRNKWLYHKAIQDVVR